ncbi:MAG TPA: hypothetical protein VE592_13040 [Geminicoccaceae bacterium]|nr:hypothetical protein [Geminicoccaceae bacterium]
MIRRFGRGQRDDRDGVNVASHQVVERSVHHALALDPALAGKRLRDDGDPKVAFAFRTGAGVTGMLRRLIDQVDAAGREGLAQPSVDRLGDAHVTSIATLQGCSQ